MITAATVSGPWNSIACATVSARSSAAIPPGSRYRFVFGTCTPPGMNGSNGWRSAGMPVAANAPIVVPW